MIKILTLVLAAVSLSTLVSGIYGMHFAIKDRKSRSDELFLLQSQIEDYRDAAVRLSELPEAEFIRTSLDALSRDHQELSTHHRKELSVYTAAKGGLEAGERGLADARAALTAGKAQYESGKKQLEMQTEAFESIFGIAAEAETLLNELAPLLYYAETVLNGMKNLIEKAYSIGDILDSSEEDSVAMRLSALEAYDAVIDTWTDAVLLVDALQDTEISTVFLRIALESASISSGEDLQALFEKAGIPVSDDQLTLVDRIMEQDRVILLTSEQVSAIRSSLEKAVGMSADDFYAKLLSERDSLAAGQPDFAFNDVQFGSIRQAYSDNREGILQFVNMASVYIPEMEAALSSAQEMISAAESMLDQMNEAAAAIDSGFEMLDEAGRQIASAEALLEESEKQLAKEEESLKQKADELEREKSELDQQEQMIQILEEQDSERQALDKITKQLSFSFQARDGLRAIHEEDENLLSAAEKWLNSYSSDSRFYFRHWFAACNLMILVTVFSLLCVPVCFSDPPNHSLLIVLAFLCLFASLGSFFLLLQIGRGISYSALAASSVSALLLLLSLLFRFLPAPLSRSA